MSAEAPIDHEKADVILHTRAEQYRNSSKEKFGLENKVVDIFSDGTRMSGTVWRPLGSENKNLPAILMCHGFGAKRGHLDYSYAPRFAAAGFAVLTFDYRGWGESDGILLAAEKQPKPDASGFVTIKARVVKKIVDPEWQLRDIDSALNFLVSEPGIDINRIGIWGSSFGGGHALAKAAKDSRIKCVVCQIGAINTHANWVNRHPQFRGETAIHQLASKHARGELFPWELVKTERLDGMPNLPKTVFEHTRNTIDAARSIRVPVLLLAAEKEETFDNKKNSELIYNLLRDKVPVEIDYLAGTHYDAYGGEAYKKGVERALKWFQVYIGDQDMLTKSETITGKTKPQKPETSSQSAKL